MSQLIQDVFIIENLQVLTEGKNNDTMKVKGVFGRCNEKNNNGRVYPTKVLESQLVKVQPMIDERRLCGELDHPQNDTVKLSNASHLITKLEMKGDELIGEAEILKTPAGLTAKALIEGGVKIGISSRGMGTLSEDSNGNKIVNEDFRLVTFDLVADPSTRGAFPGLSESTESQFARASQSKLEKEHNFVTMLQEKLRESYDPWIEEARRVKKKKAKKKAGFPDLNKDGKITKADILVGRGVIPGKKMKMEAVKAEGSWHQIAAVLADGLGLISIDESYYDDDGGSDSTSDSKGPSTRNLKAQAAAANAKAKAAKERRRTIQRDREAKGQGIRGSLKKATGDLMSATGGRLARKMRHGSDMAGEVQKRQLNALKGKTDRAAARDKVKLAKIANEDISATYQQIGFHLAEAFGLVEAKLPRVRNTLRLTYDQNRAAVEARKAAFKRRPKGQTDYQRSDVEAGRAAARAAGRREHTEYYRIGLALAEAYGYKDVNSAERSARMSAKKRRDADDDPLPNAPPPKTPMQISRQGDRARDRVNKRQKETARGELKGRSPSPPGVQRLTRRGEK